jgi:hypothetical protein
MIRHLISPSRPHKPKRPPSRTARSFNLQSFPASAGPISRSPTHDSKPPSPPTSHPHPAAAGPGRNEHWRRSPNPLAQQRESSSSPEPTCECRTDPAEPRRGTDPQRQPRHSATAKQSRAPRGYAAFLQNAPVVRHTRGFTPGWYAVPRWGTPNASPTQSPSARTTTHVFGDNYSSSSATINHPHRGTGPQSTQQQRDRAGASIGTSTS